MNAVDGPIILNGACLDLEAGTLTRDGTSISLRPRSFALLCYLAQRSGKVVRKAELLDAVWPDVIVSEDSLTQAIRDIRLAIDDPSGECLRTFRGRGYSINGNRSQQPAASTPGRTIRLAILPFAVDAVSADSRPLVSALVDDIAGGLSKFRTLTVLARGAAEAVAAIPDPRDIANRLRAQYMVQGTAQEGSDGLRLRLALVDGAEGTLVWSDSFDCSGERLLGVETDVTRRIIMHLNAGLEDEIDTRLVRQHTGSLTAFGHFARGRWAMQAFTPEGLLDAHRHFGLAVEADPYFADAWSFLGWAELAVNDYRMASQEVLDRAYGYTRRAVELAPNESLPVSTFGFVQTIIGDYESAEANISKGLRINPSNVDAMMDMATLHIFRGRPHETMTWLGRIEEINPIRYQHICRTHRSEASYMIGNYAEAARVLSFVTPMPARRGYGWQRPWQKPVPQRRRRPILPPLRKPIQDWTHWRWPPTPMPMSMRPIPSTCLAVCAWRYLRIPGNCHQGLHIALLNSASFQRTFLIIHLSSSSVGLETKVSEATRCLSKGKGNGRLFGSIDA